MLVTKENLKKSGVFLAPHNDDEALFGAFTLLREKPTVVVITDSYRQKARGFDITAEQRRQETARACDILGVDYCFLGISDLEMTTTNLMDAIKSIDADVIYAPAIEHGHVHHDMVAIVATVLWGDKVKHYATYRKELDSPVGDIPLYGTPEENELKYKALQCYESQIRINPRHFDVVYNKPEYLCDSISARVKTYCQITSI